MAFNGPIKYPTTRFGAEDATDKSPDRQDTANVKATASRRKNRTNTGQLPNPATIRIVASEQ